MFWHVDLGNILTLITITIAIVVAVREQRKDVAQRHEDNLQAMTELREEMAKLQHLDGDMAGLKVEIRELRKMFFEYIGKVPK